MNTISRHPASSSQHPVSGIQHPASGIWHLAFGILLVLLASTPAGAAEARVPAGLPDIRAVVKQRGKAVVKIETAENYLYGLARRTGRLLNPFPLRSTPKDALSLVFFVPSALLGGLRKHVGSGVLIDGDGHLLTNHHVIEGADRITVRLTDAADVKRKLDGTVLGRDSHTDIALVKIDPAKIPLVTAPLGDSDELEAGDWIIAIGHPLNLTGTVTLGVVSARDRQLRQNLIEDYIQIDAAVNPGNSGGPILDTQGQVVGIVALGMFPANNIGFAIPTNLITPVLDDLKTRRRPRRGYLGVTVQDITPDVAKEKKLDVDRGIVVTDVRYFSPAADAGLRTDDVLVRLGDHKLAKARDLQMAVLRTRPGSTVPLLVRRGGKPRTLQVKLRQRRKPFRIF